MRLLSSGWKPPVVQHVKIQFKNLNLEKLALMKRRLFIFNHNMTTFKRNPSKTQGVLIELTNQKIYEFCFQNTPALFCRIEKFEKKRREKPMWLEKFPDIIMASNFTEYYCWVRFVSVLHSWLKTCKFIILYKQKMRKILNFTSNFFI